MNLSIGALGAALWREVLDGAFDMRPRPTGNPDLDELLLYNYQATACDACGAKPAHRCAIGLHCLACCRKRAAEIVAGLEQGKPA